MNDTVMSKRKGHQKDKPYGIPKTLDADELEFSDVPPQQEKTTQGFVPQFSSTNDSVKSNRTTNSNISSESETKDKDTENQDTKHRRRYMQEDTPETSEKSVEKSTEKGPVEKGLEKPISRRSKSSFVSESEEPAARRHERRREIPSKEENSYSNEQIKKKLKEELKEELRQELKEELKEEVKEEVIATQKKKVDEREKKEDINEPKSSNQSSDSMIGMQHMMEDAIAKAVATSVAATMSQYMAAGNAQINDIEKIMQTQTEKEIGLFMNDQKKQNDLLDDITKTNVKSKKGKAKSTVLTNEVELPAYMKEFMEKLAENPELDIEALLREENEQAEEYQIEESTDGIETSEPTEKVGMFKRLKELVMDTLLEKLAVGSKNLEVESELGENDNQFENVESDTEEYEDESEANSNKENLDTISQEDNTDFDELEQDAIEEVANTVGEIYTSQAQENDYEDMKAQNNSNQQIQLEHNTGLIMEHPKHGIFGGRKKKQKKQLEYDIESVIEEDEVDEVGSPSEEYNTEEFVQEPQEEMQGRGEYAEYNEYEESVAHDEYAECETSQTNEESYFNARNLKNPYAVEESFKQTDDYEDTEAMNESENFEEEFQNTKSNTQESGLKAFFSFETKQSGKKKYEKINKKDKRNSTIAEMQEHVQMPAYMQDYMQQEGKTEFKEDNSLFNETPIEQQVEELEEPVEFEEPEEFEDIEEIEEPEEQLDLKEDVEKYEYHRDKPMNLFER